MSRESTIRARWDFLLIKRSLTLETIRIRLEVSFVTGEDGNSQILRAGVGGKVRSPWDP